MEMSSTIYSRGDLRLEKIATDEHELFYQGKQVALLQRGVLRELVKTEDDSQFREMFERVQPYRDVWANVQPDRLYHFLAQATAEEDLIAMSTVVDSIMGLKHVVQDSKKV